MRIIPDSELIINSDGSAFHLHITPDQLSDKIVMMGDPGRVTMTASFFDTIECDIQSREFHTVTGNYKGKRITALSHGIGTDNIDIVVTELDALANIDFNTKTVKDELKQLTMVRIGTSGGMQPHCPTGSYVVSEKSIGFDGLLHYYADSKDIRDEEFELAFQKHVNWSPFHCSPYVVNSDEELIDRIGHDMIKGVTITAIGFYGPQGRHVRLPLSDPGLNSKIETFRYEGYTITNCEMESSALAGLSRLMGHKAMTVSTIINNRIALDSNSEYKGTMEDLIKTVLDRI